MAFFGALFAFIGIAGLFVAAMDYDIHYSHTTTITYQDSKEFHRVKQQPQLPQPVKEPSLDNLERVVRDRDRILV